VAFGLSEMPRLAGLVTQVAREDAERRTRLIGVMAPMPIRSDAEVEEAPEATQALLAQLAS
jgi:hypothetical protein